jgi:hypothetical protein
LLTDEEDENGFFLLKSCKQRFNFVQIEELNWRNCLQQSLLKVVDIDVDVDRSKWRYLFEFLSICFDQKVWFVQKLKSIWKKRFSFEKPFSVKENISFIDALKGRGGDKFVNLVIKITFSHNPKYPPSKELD